MRRCVCIVLPLFASLAVATGAAQAVVVDMNPAQAGQSTVAYPTDHSDYYGVALVPSAREGTSNTASYLSSAGIPVVTSSAPCADPAAGTEPDILSAGSWPLNPLPQIQPICWHTGPVMHANETFTLEWEGQSPNTYWATTKDYVQTYLSDVAAASGSLSSPYSDTTQYWDGGSVQDRAANQSLFGGGCDDNGTATCRFGTSNQTSLPGNPLPSSGCPVSGNNTFGGSSGGGAPATISNNLCLTDAQIEHEVTSLVTNDHLIDNVQPGYTPLVVVMTPPGAEVCLNAAGTLCSVNGRVSPPPPTVTASATGGNVSAGTYQVVVTYVTGSGETIPSAPASITTTGSASTITVTSPPGGSGVTGWNAYVTQAGGVTFTLQQPSDRSIGTDFTLSAAPSASGATPPIGAASFCSYHAVDSQTSQPVSYVVQPWTPFTSCDEPDVAQLGANPTPPELDTSAGERLVSPLSQASMGAIVNPDLNGWFGIDGLEINDQNACQPLGSGLDSFTIGQNPYLIQREFNNTSVIDSDPYTYSGCLPNDILTPTFVAPSAINRGDTLDLDGSATGTSLGIPNADYAWDFGDGSKGTGPSVEHTYANAGKYTIKLTVTDRGGNSASITEPLQVLGPAPPTVKPPSSSGSSGLSVKLRLLPQGRRAVLRHGISVQVSANEAADGLAKILISRAAAKRAHIRVGKSPLVQVGVGTVSGVKAGTVTLNLRMKPRLARKLARLRHVTLTVRMVLVAADGSRVAVDIAGRY